MHSPLSCLQLKENVGNWVRRGILQANCFWVVLYICTSDKSQSRGHYSPTPLRQFKKKKKKKDKLGNNIFWQGKASPL